MMTGRLYIDAMDAFTTWGVYVTKDGLNELLAFPNLKTIDTNDWQEEDGVEPDLAAPCLDAHEVQLKIAASGNYSSFFSLIEYLSTGAYHVFNFASIGRTYTLRLVSEPNYAAIQTLETITIKVADDFPLASYNGGVPSCSTVSQSDEYTLDDIPLSRYGIKVLKGSLAEVKKTPNVKPNLLRNIPTLSGAIYDGVVIYKRTEDGEIAKDEDGNPVIDDKNVRYKSKEVKLTCLMRASDLTELWRNWDCLLHDLIQPEGRSLYVQEIEQTFPCYYKSCSITEFYPTGKIWLKFALTLVFYKDLRIDDSLILATEDGVPVVTEDGEYYIDLTPDK